MVTRMCEGCGKSYETTKHCADRGERSFCSNECHYAWKRSYFAETRPSTSRRVGWTRTRRRVWERDQGICHVCGVYVEFGPDYHCGHMVDRIFGGSDDMTNCVVQCRQCNLRKPKKHHTREEYETWRLDR
jgi:5-methylcytosine-specific restriction endonuclease McrA